MEEQILEQPEINPSEQTAPVSEEQSVETKVEVENTPAKEKPVVEQKKSQKVNLDDFDWDDYDGKKHIVKSAEREKLEGIYTETLSKVKDKELIEGTVVAIDEKEVLINIGYKSDGVISRSEFRYLPELKVGDKVEVIVENLEDMKGQLALSHKAARTLKSWERVNAICESNEVFIGYIKSRTKGGLIVDVLGLDAFLPGSQIDSKPVRDYEAYVGKEIELKIVKINNEFKNIVVSHKAISEEEDELQKQQFRNSLEKGGVYEGTVKNITPYGVFVDLGNGVDGLILIRDLSWKRISNPEEVVALDQVIQVVVLDFGEDRKKITLGVKQLSEAPWEALDQNIKEGDTVKGKVVLLTDYGAFVEIIPGVEGLIHVTEMSWSQHLHSAHDFLKVGEEIEVVVISIDKDTQKMSLSLKRKTEDPWTSIENKYPVGSKHTATVRNFTHFGIFVELEPGIDGLIHISDLSWTKKIKHPAEFTKVGEKIETVVLELNTESRQIKLGHKQIEDNPWDVYESVFTIGSKHEGKIVATTDRGATVVFPMFGLETFVTNRNLVKENGSMPNIEETLEFVVLDFNKDSQKIVASHTNTYKPTEEEEKKHSDNAEKEKQNIIKKVNSQTTKNTFGDLEAFSELRDQLKESEAKESDTESTEE
ncbi:30S ribosomal protein S1 [Bacteroidia bacterium]|nr:30S ribosomal protein S1 [Bacteroidia bacterium]